MPIEVSCLACGTKFKVKPSRLKKGYGKYCSRKCANVSAIPAMIKARRKFLLSKNELANLYEKQKLTAKQIGELFGFSQMPVLYWLKKYGIPRRSNSEAHLGLTPWNKGKPRTKETKMKISQARYKQISVTCQYCNKQFSVIPCRLQKGEGKYCSQTCYARDTGWQNLYSGGLLKRPTQLEEGLIKLMKRYDLPISYTGDGKIFIGRRIPDFIALPETRRKIIEVFGSYWHSPILNPAVKPERTYDGTLNYYNRHGFDCLILWDFELQDEASVLDKLNNFLGGF